MAATKIIEVPELMSIWATEENQAENLDPSIIHANASIQCWWRCDVGHLTRRLVISKRKRLDCRECGNEKLARTYEESLAYRYPALAAEWDHTMKQRMCDEKRITLLFVWQDDWETRRNSVEAAIQNYLATGELSDMLTRTYHEGELL